MFLTAAIVFLSFFPFPTASAQCNNGVTAGGFDGIPTGIYPAPDYIGGWKAAGTDEIRIVTQGSSNGALIRSRDNEHYSLEQTIQSVKPDFNYTLTFTYGNWTNGCNTSARAGIMVRVYFDDSTVPATSTEYISNDASTSSTGIFTFTTPAVVSSVRILITDYKSPKPTCGTVIDDITLLSPLTVSTGTTAVSCFGDLNGGFAVAATGGAAPYTATYKRDGEADVPFSLTGGQGNVSGLAAGDYTLSITDANNCTVTRQVTVPGPGTALTIEATPVMCYGEATGSVMVSAAGGVGGYTYTLNGTSNTTGFFGNLPAGTYTATVTDRNGCQSSTTFTIGQPATALLASATSGRVSCSGGSDGSVVVTVTGGVGPYRYTMNGTEQASGTFRDLPAGSYTVMVTDANNCTVYAYTQVDEPAAILPVATATPVTCFGGSDGTVTVTATGGSGNYSYTANGITNRTGKFSGLASGTYTVRVQDLNGGCFTETTVQVTQPVAALTATAVPVKCFGEATGSLIVRASGGTPGYSYAQDRNINDTGIFTGLPSGAYRIMVTDKAGCTVAIDAEIGEPASPLSVAASVFNNVCKGGTTGSVTAVASGGVPGYTYTLNNATSTTGTFTGLAAGTYTVYVRDANGCTASTPVVVLEPASSLDATAAVTDASCFSEADGSLRVTASGGTPGYTYTLNGDTNRTGLFSGLPAGTYPVTITDAIGCSTSIMATVGQPAAITVTAEPSWCFGQATASVTLRAAGGTPGYTYTLNGVSNTSGVFTGLTAGTYDFQIRDARNCSAAMRVVLTPATTQLTIAVTSKKDVRCFGEAAGQLIFTATGGASPYRYEINGTANTTGIFENLPAGTYTGTVTDANGCQAAVTARIDEAGTRIIPVVAMTAVNCWGGSDGTIRVTASGGTPGYRFSLNGTTNVSGTFTGLPAGTYTILVSDTENCTVSITAEVTEPSGPLAVSARPEFCGSATGAVYVTATGGTPGYTYHLDGVTNTTGVFTGLVPGTYQILVTDGGNCPESVTVMLSEPAGALSASVSGQTSNACYGSSTGTVEITARGGIPGYTFTLNGTSNSSGIFTGLAAGTHPVTVTDRNGCSVQLNVVITQPSQALAAADLVINAVNCSGESSGSIRVLATGGTPPYRYTVNGVTNTTGSFTNLPQGNYPVIITDAGGCTMTVQAEVTQAPPLVLNAVPAGVNCFGGTDGSITATATGGTPGYTYSLNAATNTTGIFRGLPAGSYVIRVADDIGCTTIAQVTITEPQALSGRLTVTHASGPGVADGSATVTITGGTPAYTYRLNGMMNTTGRFQGLSAGMYTVTVSDAAGCSLELPLLIESLNRVDLTPVMTVIPEGRTATVTATLAWPFKNDVEITLRYSGNASAKSDYLLTGQVQTIRIPKGSVTTTEKVMIHALSDAVAEPEEDVRIDISATSDPLVLIGSGAAVVIQDIVPDDPLTDDPVPENKDLFPDPTVSPNDDGQGNEYFNIGNILSFPENEVMIFNRWGNVVFKVRGYNTTDKVFRGFANTGIATQVREPLVDGVYYYVIYTFKEIGSVKERRLNKGYLILKR